MSSNGSSDAWPTPVPLEQHDLPAFPVEALPEWLGAYVQAVADATQTPTDLSGMIALGVLATCAQRRYVAQVNPEWDEQLSLWVLPLLPSGERKTAVFKRLFAPVYEREAELLSAGSADKARAVAELASADSALKKAIGDVNKAGSISDRIAARAARDEASDEHERLQNQMPPDAVLMLDDVTPERLGQVMGEVGAVTIASDEGGVFSTFAGRYSAGVPNLDLLLKSHSGGQATIDRVKRGRTVIVQPACTLTMAVQPDVLAEVSQQSSFVARGGLARFLFAIPTSRLGKRTRTAKTIPSSLADTYRRRILALLPTEPPTRRADQAPKERVMRLSSAARDALGQFEDTHEPRLDAHLGDLAWCGGWASKFPGSLVRIAALLQLADTGPQDTIELNAMQQAISMAPYFEAHARTALGIAGEDEELADARKLLTWIRGKRCATFVEREAYRACLGDDPGRCTAACELLYQHHFISPLEDPEGTIAKPGRKPSPKWETHPVLHASSVSSVGSVGGVHKQGFETLPSSITVLDSNPNLNTNGSEMTPLGYLPPEIYPRESTDRTDRTPDPNDPGYDTEHDDLETQFSPDSGLPDELLVNHDDHGWGDNPDHPQTSLDSTSDVRAPADAPKA